MKRILTLISFFLALQCSYAQVLDSLHQKMIGTWELTNYLSTNNSTGNEGPDRIKRTRVITDSHYTLTLYNPGTGQMIANVTGSYQVADSNYREAAISVTPGLDILLNKTIERSASIDEGDRLIFRWTNKDVNYTEIWSRIVQKTAVKGQLDTALQRKIKGSWNLVKFNYGNPNATNPAKQQFRRLKLYTENNYTVTDIDANTNITRTAFQGNYFVGKDPAVKDNYQENKLPLSPSIPMGVESKFVCKVFIDPDDQLHFEWLSNGVKCSETWIRIKKLN